MKLYRSAALVSTLVAVLTHSPKAQAIPAGMTDEQYIEVLKAREAKLSQPSLGVVNPDGTVGSVGRMQGSSDTLTPTFSYPKHPQVSQSYKPEAQVRQYVTMQAPNGMTIRYEAEAAAVLTQNKLNGNKVGVDACVKQDSQRQYITYCIKGTQIMMTVPSGYKPFDACVYANKEDVAHTTVTLHYGLYAPDNGTDENVKSCQPLAEALGV